MTRVTLTALETEMLSGAQGPLKRLALENIVRYAEVLGAERLCEVTKATVFCGNHGYLAVCPEDEPEMIFARMNLATEERVPFDAVAECCQAQTCVAPCDWREYAPFGQSRELFDKNTAFLDIAREAGVTIAGTCAPYLNGWLPVRGEHFVTTESGVTIIGNSLWGARCNSDGIEAAFWSAICGRTPYWGRHVPENRGGTVLVEVRTPVQSMVEWDLLGHAIGRQLPVNAIPVVTGQLGRADFNILRQFLTTVAISSNCEMCLIDGYSPEIEPSLSRLTADPAAPRLTVDRSDLEASYEHICPHGDSPIGLVSLGCPHYDIAQIQHVAARLRGRKVHPKVDLMIWTPYSIKAMADENGYTRVIEEAGGRIYTSTCPGTVGDAFLGSYPGLLFDSFKQVTSTRAHTGSPVYYAGVDQCLEVAVSGQWKEEYRWNK